MSSYRLEDAEAESKRAAVVRSAPRLVALMRELTATGAAGSEAELAAIAVQIQAASDAMTAAISGG